jgi:quercetin dioxygenase-like cupin family protein
MRPAPRFHVQRKDEVAPGAAPAWAGNVTTLTGAHVGAVHTGWSLCTLAPEAQVGPHLHSFEQSFYVLAGSPLLTLDGHTHRLAADECGLLPVGVAHQWSNDGSDDAAWLEVSAPAPRLSGPPDTFVTVPVQTSEKPQPLDIRDPRTRTFFRLGRNEMDLDSRKLGAAVDAPTVSASMATALLAYSGITVKMLVDQRLGAVLHQLFMVEYEPGGVAQPHDHPFEETYYVLEGVLDASADDERFTLGPGDLFWTGVGCVHAFHNRGEGRVRFVETQSPQPPSNYSYRFNRDWDYLAARLEEPRSQDS